MSRTLSLKWHFSRCQVIKQRIKMLNFTKAMTHRFSKDASFSNLLFFFGNFQQVSTAAGCFCGAWCIGFAKQDRCCLVMCTVSASPTVLIAVPVISRYISSSAASKHFIHIPLDLAFVCPQIRTPVFAHSVTFPSIAEHFVIIVLCSY